MATNIIQHHQQFDFAAFFENIKSQYIGLDYNDYLNFLHTDGVIHSFIGQVEGEDRVKNALRNAIASDEAEEIINRATSLMINVLRSSEAERPLMMEEMQYLNEFIAGASDKCDITWGLSEDSTIGNTVKAIVLANVKD